MTIFLFTANAFLFRYVWNFSFLFQPLSCVFSEFFDSSFFPFRWGSLKRVLFSNGNEVWYIEIFGVNFALEVVDKLLGFATLAKGLGFCVVKHNHQGCVELHNFLVHSYLKSYEDHNVFDRNVVDPHLVKPNPVCNWSEVCTLQSWITHNNSNYLSVSKRQQQLQIEYRRWSRCQEVGFFSERRSNGDSETKVQPGTRLWGRIRVGACFVTCTIRSSSMATEIWEFSLDSSCNFCNLLWRLAKASFPCLVLWSPHPQVRFSNHLSHPLPSSCFTLQFFFIIGILQVHKHVFHVLFYDPRICRSDFPTI